jgi:DNA (cytosine-5)-methyltransferase 1
VKVGSLFTGYGGLDMAVGGDLAWYSEIEPAACTVLAAHYPDVPNLGDITAVDWSAVEPVDVITGGYPCQPFSNAGKRKGTKDERHLWPYVRDAISALRPSLAVLENVRGHLSLGLADVIGDLAGLGYDARWGVVRASDAGAPHGRARVFITATNADSSRRGKHGWTVTNEPTHGAVEHACDFAANADGDGYGGGQGSRGLGGLETSHEGEPQKRQRTRGESGTRGVVDWGKYATAINRWQIITRPVPTPTARIKDRDRLNPVFVEWMMGLPEGHVTGHGLSAAQELKMLGNGVVPQQAALAMRLLGVR